MAKVNMVTKVTNVSMVRVNVVTRLPVFLWPELRWLPKLPAFYGQS
jgi:hypothetical protein